MSRLGAIFAGGMARRFGTDKAAAVVDGIAMIDHVAARLYPQCDALVAIGREWPGLGSTGDLPRSGLGPLGALAGALVYARDAGFADVLTSGCDLPDLPADLAVQLGAAPAVVAGQPLLGLWPSTLADALLVHLARNEDRSMRGWIAATGARQVALESQIANINTREDLIRFAERTPP